jgi:hypothetical protein
MYLRAGGAVVPGGTKSDMVWGTSYIPCREAVLHHAGFGADTAYK